MSRDLKNAGKMGADLFSAKGASIANAGAPNAGKTTVVRGRSKKESDVRVTVINDKNNEISGCDTTRMETSCGTSIRIMTGACGGSLSAGIDTAVANMAPQVRPRSS